MKNLAHALRGVTRWAADHDDDQVDGVYATPGPRAQGDEAEEKRPNAWDANAETPSEAELSSSDSAPEMELPDN